MSKTEYKSSKSEKKIPQKILEPHWTEAPYSNKVSNTKMSFESHHLSDNELEFLDSAIKPKDEKHDQRPNRVRNPLLMTMSYIDLDIGQNKPHIAQEQFTLWQRYDV